MSWLILVPPKTTNTPDQNEGDSLQGTSLHRDEVPKMTRQLAIAGSNNFPAVEAASLKRSMRGPQDCFGCALSLSGSHRLTARTASRAADK